VPPNDPDFGQTPEQIVLHWCERTGIPYLGRADIGHDAHNKIVPYGLLKDFP
jgi:muramoyltetrapeptide carboxypeptidase